MVYRCLAHGAATRRRVRTLPSGARPVKTDLARVLRLITLGAGAQGFAYRARSLGARGYASIGAGTGLDAGNLSAVRAACPAAVGDGGTSRCGAAAGAGLGAALGEQDRASAATRGAR